MKMKTVVTALFAMGLMILVACGGNSESPAATPTIDPDIYNQVPGTTVFEPGQCTVVLDTAVPGYTSSTLGGQSSAEVPAGSYEVGVAADYGSSLWYGLNGAGEVNYINSTIVSATEGDCATGG